LSRLKVVAQLTMQKIADDLEHGRYSKNMRMSYLLASYHARILASMLEKEEKGGLETICISKCSHSKKVSRVLTRYINEVSLEKGSRLTPPLVHAIYTYTSNISKSLGVALQEIKKGKNPERFNKRKDKTTKKLMAS